MTHLILKVEGVRADQEGTHLLVILRLKRNMMPQNKEVKVRIQQWALKPFDPLTPRSDEHANSPYNIHTLYSKQIMRIIKLIRWI